MLGILNIVVFVLIGILHLGLRIKKSFFANSSVGTFCCKDIYLIKMISFLKTLFFFLIQESALSIAIAFRFDKQVTKF